MKFPSELLSTRLSWLSQEQRTGSPGSPGSPGKTKLLYTEQRASLLSLERRQTPSFYGRDSVYLIYRKEADSFFLQNRVSSFCMVRRQTLLSTGEREREREKERISLFSIKRTQTPSLYRRERERERENERESMSLLYGGG